MGYTEMQKELTSYFHQKDAGDIIPGSDIRVIRVPFHSDGACGFQPSMNVPDDIRDLFDPDSLTDVNDNFSYYILMPTGHSAGRGPIIMLHGLNERSWDKYLSWAYRLVQDTGRAVVLFPIACHMDRAPLSWIDRHLMMPAVTGRLLSDPGIRMASFANVALSTRITATPQRFFLSGYQAVNDLIRLMNQIRDGSHPCLTSTGGVDIFAYSIGVMVSQVILLSGEGGLPADSRLFFFCGGSALNRMDGTSKLIMDSRAFERLLSFYIDEIDMPDGREEKDFSDIIHNTPIGLAYYGMSSKERLHSCFSDIFRREGDRIRTVTFSGDKVIPSAEVADMLRGSEVEIWSPDYDYIHENPFPLLKGEAAAKVDHAFDMLFSSAARFLA